MPPAGQDQLVEAVTAGGLGVITTEWLHYNYATGGRFTQLAPILPATYSTYRSHTAADGVTFTQATAHPVMNDGLPSSFAFTATSYGGTESHLVPRAGATVFYESDFLSNATPGAGLVGQQFGAGRVLSLSVVTGLSDLADPDFARLPSNAVRVAAGEGGPLP